MYYFTPSHSRRRQLLLALLCCVATTVSTPFVAAGDLILADETNDFSTVELTLTLDTPSGSTNRFDVDGALNTLVPGSVPEMASGIVEMMGQVTAKLYFDPNSTGDQLVLMGFEIMGSDFMQTPLTLTYNNLPVAVQFSTGELGTSLVRTGAGGMVGVGLEGDEYQFAPDAFHMMQNSGTASVTVPTRTVEQQLLDQNQVEGEFLDAVLFNEMASIVIDTFETEAGLNYNVSLRLPMDQQFLAFGEAGLPVELEYLTGSLAASGSFLVPGSSVPEPSTLVAASLLVGLAVWRKRSL